MNIDKIINIEHTTNEEFIVWPEFDSLSMDEYEETKGIYLGQAIEDEWGEIIAKVIELFCHKLDLTIESYMRKRMLHLKFFSLKTITVWKKELPISFESGEKIDQKNTVFFNHAVSYDMSSCTLVFESKEEEFKDIETELSAFNRYIRTGVEEAVIYCVLDKDEKTFVNILSKIAKAKGYKLVIDQKHFVSHWEVVDLKIKAKNKISKY